MATWSLKQTGLPNSATTGKIIAIIGNKAYLYGDDGYIWEYDADADTLTQISDATSWGGDTMPTTIGYRPGPVEFNDELYTYVFDAGAVNGGVWKWDGTDVSGWSKVFDDGGTLYRFFSRTANHLILAIYPDAAYTTKYSTNGTVWNDANVSDDVPAALAFDYSAFSFFTGDYSLGAFLSDRSDDAPIGPATSVIDRLFQWSEANTKWEIVNSGDSVAATGDYWVHYLKYIAAYYWRQLPATNYQFSNDRSSWAMATTDPANILPVVWNNGFADIPSYIGFDDSSNVIIYQLVDGDWASGEEITTVGSNPSVNSAFRFTNGETFLIIQSDNGTEIWGRSEPIVPPVAVNRLWIYKTVDGGLNWVSRGIQT